ncbi:Superoxide_reductase [Hexamita inflata]|uniref:Superoxide reductase n=2 Tax=Hexamita inflata TaxID=28002 RepID=A0AA86NBX3_9EUKA|nr:Superoxide reductase [Hexamita inflata]
MFQDVPAQTSQSDCVLQRSEFRFYCVLSSIQYAQSYFKKISSFYNNLPQPHLLLSIVKFLFLHSKSLVSISFAYKIVPSCKTPLQVDLFPFKRNSTSLTSKVMQYLFVYRRESIMLESIHYCRLSYFLIVHHFLFVSLFLLDQVSSPVSQLDLSSLNSINNTDKARIALSRKPHLCQVPTPNMFKSIIHEPVEGNKHVPHIEVQDNKVTVKCGKDAMHPTIDSHYIGWIKLFGLKDKVLYELGSTNFWPGLSEPMTQFQIPEIKRFTKLVAVSYCNLHGIYESEVALQ